MNANEPFIKHNHDFYSKNLKKQNNPTIFFMFFLLGLSIIGLVVALIEEETNRSRNIYHIQPGNTIFGSIINKTINSI
jgi:hypothetical protein